MEKALLLLEEECNFELKPLFIRYLHGGDINKVFLIEADNQFWVVKKNSATQFPEMLEKEFRAMLFLHEKSPLNYPKMLKYFSNEDQQFLVMEYVEEGENTSTGQETLGKN